MTLKTISILLLFVFVASNQRSYVYGRLHPEYEGPRDCPAEQSFIQYDKSYSKVKHGIYRQKRYHDRLDCGGSLSSSDLAVHSGGYLIKEIKGRLEEHSEPEHCIFELQAPEGHHINIFAYRYQFIPTDYRCINDNDKLQLADWAKFYEGKVQSDSLLYSALSDHADFNVTTKGRDLVIDIDLTGRNQAAISTRYQRWVFAYTFEKNDS